MTNWGLCIAVVDSGLWDIISVFSLFRPIVNMLMGVVGLVSCAVAGFVRGRKSVKSCVAGSFLLVFAGYFCCVVRLVARYWLQLTAFWVPGAAG